MIGEIFQAVFGIFWAHRRRAPIGNYHRTDEAEMAPMQLAYRAWATNHHLERTDGRGHVFAGLIAGRQITFTTGLAGSAPLSPELLVEVELPVTTPRLVRRLPRVEDSIATPLIEASKEVRAVGLTSKAVRVTFEKLAPSADLDLVLDVLDQEVRNLRAADVPYRG